MSPAPAYPSNIVGYYKIERFVTVGLNQAPRASWNTLISEKLKTLGPAKQVNLVVVATNNPDPSFANALKAQWLNGKKNDVVVVLGAPQYPAVAWVDVVAWTDHENFKVELRDALQQLGSMEDPLAVVNLTADHIVKNYVRKPMQDYEYLKAEIEPPLWVMILLGLFGIAASVVASYYLAQNSYRTSSY